MPEDRCAQLLTQINQLEAALDELPLDRRAAAELRLAEWRAEYVRLGCERSAEPQMCYGIDLLPCWGFYADGETRGKSTPLGGNAAGALGSSGRERVLTWVADIPVARPHWVFVRFWGNAPKVYVRGEEATQLAGTPSSTDYDWLGFGPCHLPAGPSHVDVVVPGKAARFAITDIDAVLLTTDPAFVPKSDSLPEPIKAPQLTAPRTYRDDSAYANSATGFVLGKMHRYELSLDDLVPASPLTSLVLEGAAGQYVCDTFFLRAIRGAAAVNVELSTLVGPGGARIATVDIDVRIVHVRARKLLLFDQPPVSPEPQLMPEMLLRDGRFDARTRPSGAQGGFGGRCVTGVADHESRQFWVTVRVRPDMPAVDYTGTLTITIDGAPERSMTVPVTLRVADVGLEPPSGFYSIFHDRDPKKDMTPERYVAELEDQERHGLGAGYLVGGVDWLVAAKDAVLDRALPVLGRQDALTALPSALQEATRDELVAAQVGLPGALSFLCDEPAAKNDPLDTAIRAFRGAGHKTFATPVTVAAAGYISGRDPNGAAAPTLDYATLPITSEGFSGADNPYVTSGGPNGVTVMAWFRTAVPFPLYARALAGLYGWRCGYRGAMPWAYQSGPSDAAFYDPNGVYSHATFPDGQGRPIPTLRWEALRDGIDDVRYLLALCRALRAAQGVTISEVVQAAKLALDVKQQYYCDAVKGVFKEYLCGLQPGDLDEARCQFAEKTEALRLALLKYGLSLAVPSDTLITC
jgi:hypothetical protein